MNYPADISSCREELQRQFFDIERRDARIAKLERREEELNQELTYYKEQLKVYRAKLFGRSSERRFPIDPTGYLTDVLERISEHPASRVEELLPVNWKNLPR